MIKVIILDFDGVLVNSIKPGFKRIQEYAQKLNLPVPNQKILKNCWLGNWEKEIVPKIAKEMSWPKSVIPKFNKPFNKIYYTRPYPEIKGLNSFLEKLRQNFYLMILSSRDRESLILRAKQAGINLLLFSWIICHGECKYKKPNPKIFDEILAGFNAFAKYLKPEQILYVGDTVKIDYEMARKHKPPINFVAVTTGLNNKKDFLKDNLKKIFILKSVVKLKKVLKHF